MKNNAQSSFLVDNGFTILKGLIYQYIKLIVLFYRGILPFYLVLL